MMLLKLLSGMNRDHFSNRVVSLVSAGYIGTEIQKINISVRSLEMRHSRPSFRGALELIRIIRQWIPDFIQTWMYHADLMGLIASKLTGIGKTIWGIRCSNLDLNQYSFITALTIWACKLLSPYPAVVLANSNAARRYHLGLGYRPKKFVVIPNGFDLDTFKPDPSSRMKFRQTLGLNEETVLIGHIARFDPNKDHETLFRAIGMIEKCSADIHFVLCGEGIDQRNPTIMRWKNDLNDSSKIHLLGLRHDIPNILSALDFFVSSSKDESFPNVIGEAMACGVPCVVTDVGDSALIVGETGWIVPSRDHRALAESILELTALPAEKRSRLSGFARARIKTYFSIGKIAGHYENFYSELYG